MRVNDLNPAGLEPSENITERNRDISLRTTFEGLIPFLGSRIFP
jgi:hypothetical protein